MYYYLKRFAQTRKHKEVTHMTPTSQNSPHTPPVSILLATYEPNLQWLEQQLNSLNQQSYPNLYLYVQDDASANVPLSKITALLEKTITSFSYEIARNEKNLGSNVTFQYLTEKATGDFFAYCDQDDLWFPHKISRCMDVLQDKNAVLVCSDMEIINEVGKVTAKSITKI